MKLISCVIVLLFLCYSFYSCYKEDYVKNSICNSAGWSNIKELTGDTGYMWNVGVTEIHSNGWNADSNKYIDYNLTYLFDTLDYFKFLPNGTYQVSASISKMLRIPEVGKFKTAEWWPDSSHFDKVYLDTGYIQLPILCHNYDNGEYVIYAWTNSFITQSPNSYVAYRINMRRPE